VECIPKYEIAIIPKWEEADVKYMNQKNPVKRGYVDEA
jgi:hypothetical protein